MLNGFAGVNDAICSLGYQTAQLANGLTSDIVANRFAAQQGVCQIENAINQARYDNTIGQNSIAAARMVELWSVALLILTIIWQPTPALSRLLWQITPVILSTVRTLVLVLSLIISDLQSENQALRLAASQNNYLVSQLGTRSRLCGCNCGTAAYGCGLTYKGRLLSPYIKNKEDLYYGNYR